MFKLNIERATLSNRLYRKVLHTTKHQQLVLMAIPVKADIEREKHNATQFIRIESGRGVAYIELKDGIKMVKLADGDSLTIEPNTYHYVKNTGAEPLKLYTIYSPPVHLLKN